METDSVQSKSERCFWRSICVVTLGLIIQGVSGVPAARAEVLYGLTKDGALYQVNTTALSATTVRQLPYPPTSHSSDSYTSLAVYEGTFVAVTSPSSTAYAFGLESGDEVRIGYTSGVGSVADLYTYEGTGLPRSWGAKYFPATESVDYSQFEFNPVSRTINWITETCQIAQNEYFSPYWDCSDGGGNMAATFYGESKGYFLRTCRSTNDYSQYATQLIRVELSSGTWTKTLDSLAPIAGGYQAVAADPSTDGILYVVAGTTTSSIEKISISGSSISSVSSATLSGLGGTAGIAFGPDADDVLNPRDVEPLDPYTKPPVWPAIQMLLE